MKESEIINMSSDWQVILLNEYRIRKVFSFLGIIIDANGLPHLSKKLFGYVLIKERKVKERFLEYGLIGDDTWTVWTYSWDFVEVIKDNKK